MAATIASRAAADEVLTRVARHWGGEDIDNYECEEIVMFREEYIHRTDLMSNDAVFAALTARRSVQDAHRAQAGDSYYSIARSAGMTLDQLFAANPNVNPDAFLQEGQVLLVTRNLPILSVITTERVERDEIIPIPIEVVSVRTLPVGQQSVVQLGIEGLQRVTAEVVRVNDNISEERIISIEIIRPAVTEIIQIGAP